LRKNQRSKALIFFVILLFIGVSFTTSTGKIGSAISKNIIYNGSLLGYVNDSSGTPIEGALVRVHFHETYEEDYSNSIGFYHVKNIPICYCLKNATCSKEGYKTEWILLSIVENTTHDFVLNSGNHPPSAPTVKGPGSGIPNVTYDFDVNSVDPDGDNIRYHIDWGDGECETTTFQESGIDVIVAHSWFESGIYYIVIEPEDTHGANGDEFWGKFVVGKSKSIKRPILSFFHSYSNQFLLLQRLLEFLM
jgi:hypothetical protein